MALSDTSQAFFCSVGRGTEKFVVDEIKDKLAVHHVEYIDGKVFFQADPASEPLRHTLWELKTVERIFVCLHRQQNVKLAPGRKGWHTLTSCISSLSQETWTTAHEEWKLCCTSRPGTSDCPGGAACIRGNNTETDTTSPPQKYRKLENPDSSENVTFRVSCKVSGRPSRQFRSQELSKSLGVAIKHHLGWVPDLKHADLEIFIQLNDQGLIIGFPITRVPLSNRSYLHDIGLRTTISYIMAKLTEIKSEDLVVDPMCGCGTILVEAAKSWPEALYIGCDSDRSQLDKAEVNISTAEECKRIFLMQADVSALPLASHSVSRVVCDLPFGQQYSDVDSLKLLYPKIIISIDRILKPGGKAVLLTSHRLKKFLFKTIHEHTQEAASIQDKPSTMSQQCERSSITEDIPKDSVNRPVVQHPTEIQQSTSSEADNERSSQDCLSDKSLKNIVKETQAWVDCGIHYVKLGETDAFICHFEKRTAIH